MRSVTSRRFRELFHALPAEVRRHALRAYQLFKLDPSHPGLKLKKVDDENSIYSVRIGLGHRALGQMDGDDIV